MLRIGALLLLSATSINCCSYPSFTNTTLQVKGNNENAATFIQLSGCITAAEVAKLIGSAAVTSVECSNQTVPFFHEGAVADLPELRRATFTRSKIEKLKRNAFNDLPKLESLDLSGNLIASVDQSAFGNLNLQLLRLDDNKIRFLSDAVFAMPQLSTVALSRNSLDSFEPEWFSADNRIYSLFLDNNLIRKLQKDAFTPFKKLHDVDLSRNLISEIHHEAFRGLEGLGSIYLPRNRLAELPPDVFVGLSKLSAVWLHDNNLTYVPTKVLEDLGKADMFQITVHGNPLQCACFEKVTKWAADHDVYVVEGEECFNEKNPVCVYTENEDVCVEEELSENVREMYYDQFNFNCRDE